MRRSVRWTLVIPLLLVMATACLLPGGRTASTSRTIDAAHGGELRAPHGIVLDVPPHVLTADGSASITDVGQGEYDIHIAVPWTGSVNVTVPISGDQDAVVHSVGGWWVAEGTGPGQARVSVTQLSVFSTLSGLAKKGVDAACLTWDPTAFVNCLALKGVQYVNKQLTLWIASKISDSCTSHLVASAVSGPIGPKGVPVTALLGILKGMFTGSCVGHAGETWTPPPTSAPPAVTPPAGPAPRPTQTTRPTAAPPASTPTPLATVTPAPPPPPSTPTPAPPPPSAHAEQASVHHSVPTFANYHNASGPGPAIPASTWVQVTCKVYDPTIVSASPDGYWYRIASSPWTGLYAVANTFMNGDPPSGPYTHNTDYAVPNC